MVRRRVLSRYMISLVAVFSRSQHREFGVPTDPVIPLNGRHKTARDVESDAMAEKSHVHENIPDVT